ncbi:helix-turn-helix transcriptional regulator [Microbacterium sp. SLBN-111]|uniref:helix-turn-helix transcriptional regulator n=1 Tax=Microbacterium sp. SLBN-111 TaxID=3377733 RepID=UPI003C79052F
MSAPADTRSLDRLLAARDAGGGHAVLRVLADHWDELRSEHPRELLLTLDAMSEQVLRGNPQLRHYRRYLEDHLDQATVRGVSGGGPLHRLRSLTRHAVAARTLGRTAIAARRVDAARHFLSTLPRDVVAGLAPSLPSLQYEWAATYVQVGRFSDALAQFTDALESARRAGDRGSAAASGGGAALLSVLEGRGRDASAVLDAVAPGSGSDVADPSSGPGLIAQAWIHLDRLDHTRASALLAGVCIADTPAYWVPYFVARISLAAARREGREALLADFDGFVHSLAARGAGSSAHAEMVAAVRQLLIVQLQRPAQSGSEPTADAASDRTWLLPQLEAIVRARHLVDRGRADQARKVLPPLLEVDESVPRVLIPALLLAAEIDPGRNVDAHLRRAARLALSHGHFSPFLNSPPEIRRQAADVVAAGGEEEMADRIRSLPPRTLVRDPGELSGREMDVVELAVDGLKNLEIAARLHLSPNTVKSHLRSAYGKLGVSTKKHLAERLGARA